MSRLGVLQIGLERFDERPGGLNRLFSHLVRELTARGDEVTGLVAGSSVEPQPHDAGVRAVTQADASLTRRLFAMRAAARPWLRQHPRGVVAAHFALNTLPLLDLLGEHPLVVHFHGPWGQESRLEGASIAVVRLKELVEQLVYRRADQAIVLSASFGDLLHARFGVPRERITVVPGGVEIARFAIAASRATARAQLGWPSDRPIVLCVRRLVRRVGLDLLINAAVILRDQVPGVLVLIAGRGPLHVELQAQIVARGVEQTVRLIGFVADDELPLAYRAADLGVVPSTGLEGFGLIVAESLAAGTPVVVTPVGGLAEVVTPLAGQLVAPAADAASLAATLARALTDRMPVPHAAACAAYAAERFAWPVVAGQIRQVYERAVRPGARA